MTNPCITCGDNEAIDGFYCFGCGVDIYYSEGIFDTAETQEECYCDICVPVCAENAIYPLDVEVSH